MPAVHDEAATSRKGAWHQSSLETILNGCSWQWALQHVLGQPDAHKPASEAGTAFHSAVEAHEKERMEHNNEGISLDEMKTIAHAHLDVVVPKILEVHYPLDKKTGQRMQPAQVYDLADNALEAWYSIPPKGSTVSNREFLLDFKPLALEPYFRAELVKGAMPVGGWVDGIYQYPDGAILIIDQKTAKDFSRWGEGTHRLQATMYSVGAVLSDEFNISDLSEVEFMYHINRTTIGKTKAYERARRMQVVPDLEDVALLGTMIREAQRVFDTEDYVRNPGWGPLCSATYCPFFKPCMETQEWNIPFPRLKELLTTKD